MILDINIDMLHQFCTWKELTNCRKFKNLIQQLWDQETRHFYPIISIISGIIRFSIYFPCYWFEIGCIRDISHKKVVIWKIFFGCNGLSVDFDVWEATISVWILCRILGRTCINVENSVEYDWPVSILELFIKVQKLFSASFHLISLPGGGMTKWKPSFYGSIQ